MLGRAMPMFPVWRQILSSMVMNTIISRPSSSKSSPLLIANADSISIGYMIMLYPSCIIISHIGPSIWLPACEVSSFCTERIYG